MVKRNIPHGSIAPVVVQVAQAVLDLRKGLGFTQRQLAEALGISQGNVAKWESGKLMPPGQLCVALSKMVPEDQRTYWLKLAGFTEAPRPARSPDERYIPLLRDAAAAGTPRQVNEREIEQMLAMPRSWFPRSGNLYAVTVAGDSMEPILLNGHIAIIDVNQRDPERLNERMVAAREGDGVTIKWLRRDGEYYILVPQHVSTKHPVRIMRPDGDFSIVGAVIKWIGEPPTAKR